jgi:hypothetical protein
MAYDGLVRVVKDEDLAGDGVGHTSLKYALGAKHLKNGNEYVYVCADKTITTGKYGVLVPDGTSLCSGYTLTYSNASLNGWLAGVAQNTIATGYYGFVMTKGVSLVAPDSGEVSAAPGVDLALGTNGGFIAAGATFSTAPRFGVTINSFVTTVGTSKARIFGSIL